MIKHTKTKPPSLEHSTIHVSIQTWSKTTGTKAKQCNNVKEKHCLFLSWQSFKLYHLSHQDKFIPTSTKPNVMQATWGNCEKQRNAYFFYHSKGPASQSSCPFKWNQWWRRTFCYNRVWHTIKGQFCHKHTNNIAGPSFIFNNMVNVTLEVKLKQHEMKKKFSTWAKQTSRDFSPQSLITNP